MNIDGLAAALDELDRIEEQAHLRMLDMIAELRSIVDRITEPVVRPINIDALFGGDAA